MEVDSDRGSLQVGTAVSQLSLIEIKGSDTRDHRRATLCLS